MSLAGHRSCFSAQPILQVDPFIGGGPARAAIPEVGGGRFDVAKTSIGIMISYIDVYVGEWGNEAGNRLSIRKFDDKTCFVSFFQSQDNLPIRRPCQHRIRHYGFLGNGNRAANIARIR